MSGLDVTLRELEIEGGTIARDGDGWRVNLRTPARVYQARGPTLLSALGQCVEAIDAGRAGYRERVAVRERVRHAEALVVSTRARAERDVAAALEGLEAARRAEGASDGR